MEIYATSVVEIVIRGDERQKAGSRLPLTRDDQGIIRALLVWEIENNVIPVFCSSVGGGVYHCFYRPEDAIKVSAKISSLLDEKGLENEAKING